VVLLVLQQRYRMNLFFLVPFRFFSVLWIWFELFFLWMIICFWGARSKRAMRFQIGHTSLNSVCGIRSDDTNRSLVISRVLETASCSFWGKQTVSVLGLIWAARALIKIVWKPKSKNWKPTPKTFFVSHNFAYQQLATLQWRSRRRAFVFFLSFSFVFEVFYEFFIWVFHFLVSKVV